MLISARTLDEYKAMFVLTEEDISSQSFLDCAAGASSFTASIERDDCVALDVAYGLSFIELSRVAKSGLGSTRENLVNQPERYNFSETFTDVDDHSSQRLESCERFLRDFQSRRRCYIEGDFSQLPFDDSSFDIVLCSHALFLHSDTIDPAEHIKAVREMCRVAKREVRIYPLVGMNQECPAETALDGVESWLSREGYAFSYIAPRFAFFKEAVAGLWIDIPA